MYLLIFAIALVACMGLTWIAMYGTILDIPRGWICKLTFFDELLSCAMCTGTWAGMLLVGPVVVAMIEGGAPRIVAGVLGTMLPPASSAVCYFIDRLLNMIEEIYQYYAFKNGNDTHQH